MTTANPRVPTVDRAARNLYAAALSGYMRGELDNLTLDDVFDDLSDTRDDTLFDAAYLVWQTYDDLRAHPIDVNEPTWNTLERICVFMTTELVHERHRDATQWNTPRQTAAWIVLALLTGFVIGGLASGVWWIALAGWCGLGVAWCLRMLLTRDRSDDPTHANPYWPFADQGQWLEHADRLDEFELPTWSPQMTQVRVRSSIAEWLFRLQAGLLVVVFLPVVLIWSARPQPQPGSQVIDLAVHPPTA